MPRLYVTQGPVPVTEMTESETQEYRASVANGRPWPVRYLVRKTVGTTSPRIGAKLSEADLAVYVALDDWYVEIT